MFCGFFWPALINVLLGYYFLFNFFFCHYRKGKLNKIIFLNLIDLLCWHTFLCIPTYIVYPRGLFISKQIKFVSNMLIKL